MWVTSQRRSCLCVEVGTYDLTIMVSVCSVLANFGSHTDPSSAHLYEAANLGLLHHHPDQHAKRYVSVQTGVLQR